MKLRDMLTAAVSLAGDLDEPVYVRIVTRGKDGSVVKKNTREILF